MYNLTKNTDFIQYIESWKNMTSLEHKVNHAQKMLLHVATHFAPHEVAVAWTGGKDSTVLLALWREALHLAHPEAKPLALNLDTGHKFPEIITFRDEIAELWQLNVHIARPDWTALETNAPQSTCSNASANTDQQDRTYPVANNKMQCCRDLKVLPLAKALRTLGIKVLLTGVRADEHEERAKHGMMEIFHSHESQNKQNNDAGHEPHTDASNLWPDHIRLHAILAFTEMDIWSYTMNHAIPYCSLYTKGYRSLGCVPCTQLISAIADKPTSNTASNSERAGRNQDKEAAMQSLHELGYF